MTVLITGAWRASDADIARIEKMGHTVCLMPDERADLPIDAKTVEAVICNGLFLYHDIDSFSSLRYIQLTSAGLDRAPVEKIKERGIALYNARGVYSVPMAEFALFGVLSLYKKAEDFIDSGRGCRWEKQRDIRELYGKRVLIVGAGSVGVECAKRFGAFGCSVVGVDALPRVDESFIRISPVDRLEEELSAADVTVLTLPLTPETHHIINARTLAAIKPGSVLVNISRGGTLDTDALITALDEGRLSGAVLDVFEQEPLPAESPLWDRPNVLVTPHNSFVGEGNAHRLSTLIFENLERI